MVVVTIELILEIALKVSATIFPILLSIAYLVYFERKIIASMQLRKGPAVVGPFGLLQPIADALKFVFKEIIIPKNVNFFLFLLAPVIAFVLALIQFVVIPFDKNGALAEINVGVLYLLSVSGLAVYGILLAGIASDSRYSFMGAVRAAASMISYEVSIGLIILTMVVLTGSLNLSEIIEASHSFPLFLDILLLPLLSVFFIAILAETNRHPFDLPESESELVGGYNVEYSSLAFAMFFLAEYANMILMSSVVTIFFLGGWYPPFSIALKPSILWFILKVLFVLFMFIS